MTDFDDVVIGASAARVFDDTGGRPQSFVLFGKADLAPNVDLSGLNGSDGFAIAGLVGSGLGAWVDGGGDLNGDGLSDIVLGAPDARGRDGQSIVVFGSTDPFPAIVDVGSLGSQDGLALNGDNRSGGTVSFGGDINGDGADDLLIGQGSGVGIYVFFGDPDGGSGSDGGDGGDGGNQTPPTVTDDVLTVDLVNGQTQTLDLLANDTDAEGDALAVVAVNGDATEIGTNMLLDSGAILRVDSNGAAQVSALASSFVALPDGISVSETVTYTVEDARGASAAGTVTITVVGTNDGPEHDGALLANAVESDAPFTLDLLQGATDPDEGDTLSVAGAVLSGNDFGVRLDGDTLRVTPSVYLTLDSGEQAEVIVDYDIVDRDGAATARRATVVVDGEAGFPPFIDPPAHRDDDPQVASVFVTGPTAVEEGTGNPAVTSLAQRCYCRHSFGWHPCNGSSISGRRCGWCVASRRDADDSSGPNTRATPAVHCR